MPEDTFEDIRERLFEAAWGEPTYAPDPERAVRRARRRAGATVAGVALAALGAIAVVASSFPEVSEDRTGNFTVAEDHQEFVVDLDTGAVGEVRWVPDHSWVFELSPQGDTMALTREIGGRNQVWVSSKDGTDARTVTDDPVEAYDANWSPDGRSLVYVGWGRNRAGRDLFILDLETGRNRRLTRTGRDESNPEWSPDGSRVLYHVAVPGSLPEGAPPGVVAGTPGSFRLEVIDVRTRQVRVLAGGPRNAAIDGSWLSDDRIVYMRGVDIGLYDPSRWALTSVAADGTDRQEIAEVPSDHWAWEAVVSPDGTRIAFASDLDGSQWVLIHDLSTGETTRVTPGWYPMWLDDRHLLVQRDPAV